MFIVSAATTTYSLWSTSALPRTLAVSDTTSKELGVKFQASVAGNVTGVRFYKSAQNTGVHTGDLWDNKGNLLASVQFSNETASGWQTALFAKPVSIAANVTYVISYIAPNGHYSLNPNYFVRQPHTTKKLIAPQNSTSASNGVYASTSTTSQFPTQSGNGANYWVDVLFNTQLLSPQPAPAAPTGLSATAQADNSVLLNWQASASANSITQYTVYRNGNKLATTSGSTLTYTDTSTQPGTTYSYQIQATDSTSATSALSASVSTTTASSTPPTSGGGSTGGTTSASCLTTTNVPGGADSAGGCWPGPNTTGPNNGLMDASAKQTLSAYSGPCVITTDNAVIDSKVINCSAVEIQAKAVVIKNSVINGQVYINSDDPRTSYNLNWSLILQDSEVNAPQVQEPAVFEGAITAIRDNIHGGITSIQCGDKAAQCIIQDSWLHGQLMPQGVDWHLGGFHSIGGTNYTITHNSVICDTPVNNVGGGCSGDLVFIPYDKNISHALVQHNLMGASTSLSYCLYGGDKPGYTATYMVFKDNVFNRGSNGKCGDFGPVAGTSATNTGNVWTNNTWDNGGTIAAEE
ncbi:MAG TPA: DUF4082 domain-containing protein [Candidatus Saccharimonadales bacterium]|nr:DUF4082 domain-containing protein [Candidatus Saccharimonadales bacterium]